MELELYIAYISIFIGCIGIIISCIAVIIAIISYVGQMNILVLNQLSEKAKDCNNLINWSNFEIILRNFQQISNILSVLITAIQLMDYHYKTKWYLRLLTSRQKCLDQFYLQLHTSIRIFVGRDSEYIATQIQSIHSNKTLNDLFRDASGNLNASYKKFG